MKKIPSYGRIKETTIGGIFMSRRYRHIKEYEKEIMRLKEEGVIEREIPFWVVATIFATKIE
jgi:hypothetical protein